MNEAVMNEAVGARRTKRMENMDSINLVWCR